MEHVHHGYRGLGVLMELNWDRLLYVATTAVALGFGAWVGSLLN